MLQAVSGSPSSDTPETDAFSEGFDYRGLPCLANAVRLARKLELQRNAITTAARNIVDAWDEDEIGQIDGGLIDAMRELFPENAGGMARELAAQKPESTTDLNG